MSEASGEARKRALPGRELRTAKEESDAAG